MDNILICEEIRSLLCILFKGENVNGKMYNTIYNYTIFYNVGM
jgi:hypothetical protein